MAGSFGWSGPVSVLSGVPWGWFWDYPVPCFYGLAESSCLLFPDSCVLCGSMCSIRDCFTLQGSLPGLGWWEADWQMGFNVAESHSVRVTRRPRQMLFGFSLHGQILGNVQSAGCLGVTVSGDMNWGQLILGISSRSGLGTQFPLLGLGFCA